MSRKDKRRSEEQKTPAPLCGPINSAGNCEIKIDEEKTKTCGCPGTRQVVISGPAYSGRLIICNNDEHLKTAKTELREKYKKETLQAVV